MIAHLESVAAEPRASLLVIHGLAEYALRYRAVAHELAQRGISTFGFDQCGHGSVSRPRTHVERFDLFVDDAQRMCEQICAAFPRTPLFVWGHSMGAMVALLLATRKLDALSGLIVTSSSLDVFKNKPNPLHPFFRFWSALAPRVRVPTTVDAIHISRDEAMQRAYAGDQLIPGTASLRLIVEFARANKRIEQLAGEIQLPTLIVHGGADAIAPSSGSERLHALLGTSDKELRIYPELRHELQNEQEPERSMFIDAMAAWVLARAATVGHRGQE
jgi:alpha-beta hydrolase superfamily lysophospholipase